MKILLPILKVFILTPCVYFCCLLSILSIISLAQNQWILIFKHPLFIAGLSGILFRFFIKIIFNYTKKTNPFGFLDTLEHEITHAIFGYLTLSPPTSLKATQASGGEVTLKNSNPVIILSPYIFPLTAGIAYLIGWTMRSDIQIFWNYLTAVLFGNFLYRVSTEIRWYQSDLKAYGFFFSMGIISLFFTFQCLIFIQFVMGKENSIWNAFLTRGRWIILHISPWFT